MPIGVRDFFILGDPLQRNDDYGSRKSENQ
jgi:hypothetical protein